MAREAGAALSAHPLVDYVTFTGSPLTGTAIQQAAAVNNRGVTMELGGKSPQIVFADADLDAAAAGAGQRHHPERRPDLLGRQPRAGREAGL